MIFQIASRNLTRDKRRTFITSLMLIFSAVLVSFILGLSDGSYSKIINLFTRNYTGHFKIETKKYVDENLLYYTIKDTASVEKELESNSEVLSYTKRSFSGGLVFSNKKTFGASLVGVDWKREEGITEISKRLQENFEFQNGEYQVALGFKLAKYFGLKVGDELVVIGSGADGSIANDVFTVKSIFKEDSGERDDYAVYMDLDTFNEYHTLAGVHEYSVLTKNIANSRSTAKKFKVSDDLIARPWQEVEEDFYISMDKDKQGTNVSLLIIMFVVGLGVMNTILMSILERTKEFGLMKALGTTPSDISKIIILESFFLATISIVIGVSIGAICNYLLARNGIAIEPISYGGMVMDTMIAENSVRTVLFPTILLYVTTMIATIFPIVKANQVSPIESMRGH